MGQGCLLAKPGREGKGPAEPGLLVDQPDNVRVGGYALGAPPPPPLPPPADVRGVYVQPSQRMGAALTHTTAPPAPHRGWGRGTLR